MAEIPVFWQPLSIPDVLASAHQWRSMTWLNFERTDFSCAWQPCWSVDPTCIPMAGLREEDLNKSWNSTHTELTSYLALHLTKTDLTLSFPVRSIFKEPNTANKEPRELKNDSYGWVEKVCHSIPSQPLPPNSYPQRSCYITESCPGLSSKEWGLTSPTTLILLK